MIYHFKITSPESIHFHLEIEMDSEHTFYDFHTAIQKSIGYESYHLASFFLSDENGRRNKEISLLDTGMNGGVYYTMHKSRIADFQEINQQHLIYTYDFINDRSLNLEFNRYCYGKKSQ